MLSPVVRAADLVFTGSLTAADPDGIARGNLEQQTGRILDGLRERLTAVGGTLDDVVNVVSFHTDLWRIDEVLAVAAGYFTQAPPAWTAVGVASQTGPGVQVALRVVADLSDGQKTSVRVGGQQWLGKRPVASACGKNGLIFISGQGAAAGADGSADLPGDHQVQAEQAYQCIKDAVALAGGTVDDLLDFTSYHLDIRGAPATFDDVYVPQVIGRVPVDDAATTSHVGATGLHLPGMLGAYTAIADLTPGRRDGSTPDSVWWKETHPLAAATRKPGGRLITVAGHVAAKPDGSIIHPGDPEGQLRFILGSMADTMRGYGLTLDAIAEIILFTKDARRGHALRPVLAEYFTGGTLPAISSAGMTGLWLEGFELEVAALAVSR